MKTKVYLFSLVVLFISGCYAAYVPNVINAPLLNNKKETQITLNAGFSGYDGQLAVAISKNIGVMANVCYVDTSNSNNGYNKHLFYEAGIGYYTISKKLAHFEVFGGYGMGKVDAKNVTSLGTFYTKASISRIFIQPDLGFSSEIFDLAFAPRLVYVMIRPDSTTTLDLNHLFLEPTLMVRIGYQNLFFTTQMGFSIPITKLESSTLWGYHPFLFSVGIQFKIWKIYDTTPTY